MADTQPPGGWPWGKGKQGSQNPGSEVAHGSQAHKGVQEPELQQLQPEAEGSQTPIRMKDDAQSQGQSKTGGPPTSALRSPESVTNKSVKYEDDQPVSVKAPGSNKSFSRTGKDPSVVSNGLTNGAGEEAEEETADGVTERAQSTKGGIPEDEGKDLTEPGDENTEGQTEKDPSQSGSRFTGFLSGAKNLVPSFGGSKQGGSQMPDSVRQLQEQAGSQGGENLTLPGEQASDLKTSTEEDTPAETEDGATTAIQTGEDATEGLPDGEELRPEDSITHAADNSRLPTEGQEGTELPTEAQQTELPEGASQVPTSQIPEGGQLPEGVSADQETELPEGGQLPEGVSADQKTTAATETTGYETAATDPADIDFSILKGCKVNKLGNVVNENGQAIGRITQGIMAHLIGKKVDENGIIWNDSGKEIGRAQPIPDNELQDMLDPKPFESFEGNVIDGKGWVKWQEQTVGKVVEGDLKAVQGKSVDADGEILDKNGNVIGKAERWEEEEPEPEPEAEEIDMSILAGKRVNKAGNVVDSSGVIYGRIVDGDIKRIIGRMCNKNGEIVSESGDVLGHAELVSEGEREGSKEGPFAELSGLTVAKDGTVVTPSGDIVGRLVKGDPKVLAGRTVDEDGDVVDRNGNELGHAERWEPEAEPEKEKGPLAGLHVNNEGNVVDKSGNIIAKLTSGDPHICAGKEIDDDGDVVNSKGMTVGHVNLLSDIKEPEEPEDTEEEIEARKQQEQDKKLANQMAYCLEQCLDKIKPICKMITTKIEAAERQPEEERDEEQLVKEVRPLIEEGGNILREAHGIIRGLDPDGHIQANAKHKSGTREATPEEFHLAEVIKEVRPTHPIPVNHTHKPLIADPSINSLPVPSPRLSRARSASSRICLMPRKSSTHSGVSWASRCSRSSLLSACCSAVY